MADPSKEVTTDITVVTIPNGEVIEELWHFHPDSQKHLPAGIYPLRLSYFDSQQVIENFCELR